MARIQMRSSALATVIIAMALVLSGCDWRIPPSPNPTPTKSPSASATPTASPSPSATPTPTPSPFPSATPTLSPTEAPATAVDGLRATVGSSAVGLEWNAVDGDSEAILIRRGDGSFAPVGPTSGSPVAELAPAVTHFVDEDRALESEYAYSVFVRNSAGNYGPAASVTVTTNGEISINRATDITEGTTAPIELSPDLDRVVTLKTPSAGSSNISVTLDSDEILNLSAAVSSAGVEETLRLEGTGCLGERCNIAFAMTVNVRVISLGAGGTATQSFTQPAPDRIVAASILESGSRALNDEVMLTLGTELEPGPLWRANEIAAEVGAFVTGAYEQLGVYELRWVSPPSDIDAVVASISAMSDVSEAVRSTLGNIGETAQPPGDWSDDGPAGTWHLTEIRAEQAWDRVDGESVAVGVVDAGTVLKTHEDLDVRSVLGSARSGAHATHVAGLACAVANGAGVVGAAWGCPVTSIGLRKADTSGTALSRMVFYKEVWAQARALVVESDVRIVNMSLGLNLGRCATRTDSAELQAEVAKNVGMFRRLFNGPDGRDVVWTLSAGNNCGVGADSPWGATWSLPNVITVAATNRGGDLASFSNFGPGVEVAAPGGVGTIVGSEKGVWSTSQTSTGCGWFWREPCETYEALYGTSMAAPLVAGVAALVTEANPSLTASEVAGCIVSTSGKATGVVTARSPLPGYKMPPIPGIRIPFSGTIPRVDAEAAVNCATSGPADADILVLGQGDRTSSGNGTDIGDVIAELTTNGYSVVHAMSMPRELSGFDQVWHIDTEALAGEKEAQLAEFIRGGGGAYLTGEWGCCSVTDTSVRIINDVTFGPDVSFGGTADTDTITFSATGPTELRTTPNNVSSIETLAAGYLSGVEPANVVGYGSSPDQAVVGAWGPADVAGGGRVVAVLDINWLAQQYRDKSWGLFAENIANFLK